MLGTSNLVIFLRYALYISDILGVIAHNIIFFGKLTWPHLQMAYTWSYWTLDINIELSMDEFHAVALKEYLVSCSATTISLRVSLIFIFCSSLLTVLQRRTDPVRQRRRKQQTAIVLLRITKQVKKTIIINKCVEYQGLKCCLSTCRFQVISGSDR